MPILVSFNDVEWKYADASIQGSRPMEASICKQGIICISGTQHDCWTILKINRRVYRWGFTNDVRPLSGRFGSVERFVNRQSRVEWQEVAQCLILASSEYMPSEAYCAVLKATKGCPIHIHRRLASSDLAFTGKKEMKASVLTARASKIKDFSCSREPLG